MQIPPYEVVLDKSPLEVPQSLDEMQNYRTRKALNYFRQGNYHAAAELWRVLKNQCGAVVSYNEAVCWVLAAEGHENLQRAFRCFQIAADAGITEAKLEAAIALACGRGVLQDGDQALLYLRSAAEDGHVLAQKLLGLWLLEGNPVAKNVSEGTKWLAQAAQAGDQEAMLIIENRSSRPMS